MCLIDTPGYGENRDISVWYKLIKGFIADKVLDNCFSPWIENINNEISPIKLNKYRILIEKIKVKNFAEKNLYFKDSLVSDERVIYKQFQIWNKFLIFTKGTCLPLFLWWTQNKINRFEIYEEIAEIR